MSKIRVNLTSKVNSSQIKREVHNGRNILIVPSRTLPANVIMNGGLYPAEEIDAHYKKLEGTLAPLGHPEINGEYISAFSPEGINLGHIGAWNRNVKKAGNRIYLEKWIDVEVAERSEGGKRLLKRIAALDAGEDVPPIHTSVACYIDQIEASEEEKKNGYDWIAKIYDFDHDAILLDEVGAATPEQGVGMMVNCDNAKIIKVNEGALIGESMREKERRLDKAVKDKFILSDNDYAYVLDFTDSQMIVVRNGGKTEVFGYKQSNGKIEIDDNGEQVERRESWYKVVANHLSKLTNLSSFLTRPDEFKANSNKDEIMPLTKEEKEELNKEFSANVGTAIAEALKPISEAIVEIRANHKAIDERITANERNAENEMREAVAKKIGTVAANALTGDALADAFKQIAESQNLSGNSQINGNNEKFEAPTVEDYFGK